MSPRRRIILVFLKFPTPGKVKTRLAAGLKNQGLQENATEIYKRLVFHVFKILAKTDFDSLRIQFDPPEAETEIRDWLAPGLAEFSSETSIQFVPQAAGDLGDRLQNGVDSVFSEAPAKVAVIGTDCIEIQPDTFSQTWNELDSADLVFGPTFDGGYYLVALKNPAPEIFTDVPWSTEKTLPASIKKAEQAGKTVALLGKKNDVDTVDDWKIAESILG